MTEDRFVERRRMVAEDRARRYLRRTMTVIVLAAIAAAGSYVVNSPLLSLDVLRVEGVHRSQAESILAAEGIVVGAPMAFLDLGSASESIESSPWVVGVSMERQWPRSLTVTVEERIPLAVVGPQRRVVAADGFVLDADPTGLPTIALDGAVTSGRYEASDVLGSLQFVDALRPDLLGGLRVSGSPDGLIAETRGYLVRLGRPVDMVEKARALGPVIDQRPPEGSEITLLAPSRPSVLPPGQEPGDDTRPEDEG